MTFLNEVKERYPGAISLAPGAPNPESLTSLELTAYLDRYVSYIAESEKLTRSQAERRLYEYGPARGHICDLVASLVKQDLNIGIAAEAIVVTAGCQEAMLLALRALKASRNDVLAVVVPCYVGIIGVARFLDCEIVAIGEGSCGVDLSALKSQYDLCAASGKRIRALYIAPDFSNPSGSQLDYATRLALLQLAQEKDFLILEDGTYSFTGSQEIDLPSLKCLDSHRRVVYLGTFSKVCFPGARVGFLLADQEVYSADQGSHLLAEDLATLKTMTTINTSPVCQALIGGMILEEGGSLRHLVSSRAALYQRNLRALLGALNSYLGGIESVSWNEPKGGFFVVVTLPTAVDDWAVRVSGSQYGVLWTPMSVFYPDSGVRHQIRLSCSYVSVSQIDEGVRRFASFVVDLLEGRL